MGTMVYSLLWVMQISSAVPRKSNLKVTPRLQFGALYAAVFAVSRFYRGECIEIPHPVGALQDSHEWFQLKLLSCSFLL